MTDVDKIVDEPKKCEDEKKSIDNENSGWVNAIKSRYDLWGFLKVIILWVVSSVFTFMVLVMLELEKIEYICHNADFSSAFKSVLLENDILFFMITTLMLILIELIWKKTTKFIAISSIVFGVLFWACGLIVYSMEATQKMYGIDGWAVKHFYSINLIYGIAWVIFCCIGYLGLSNKQEVES